MSGPGRHGQTFLYGEVGQPPVYPAVARGDEAEAVEDARRTIARAEVAIYGADDATRQRSIAESERAALIQSVKDARRYAAHLEAEIAEARKVWEKHDRFFGACPCVACRIARVFGWDAP